MCSDTRGPRVDARGPTLDCGLLRRWSKSRKARYLWISYHDYAGLARAKAVGPDRLDDALLHGVGWAKANWDLAITDHQVPKPAFAADSGDFRLVPDAATIRPLPHRAGAALAYGWMTTQP